MAKLPQKTVDLKAAAAIPELVLSPLRASPKLAKSADEHVLQKAARRTTVKNLEGNSDRSSLFLLNHECVVSNFSQLGVNIAPKVVKNLCMNAFNHANPEKEIRVPRMCLC